MKNFKTTIVTATILFSFTAKSQLIKDHKIDFEYIQLPKHHLDNSITTFHVVYGNSFQANNERQKMIHQLAVDSAEAQQKVKLTNWEKANKEMKKKHLINLSLWKEKTNQGTQMTKPKDPVWPTYPEPYFLFPTVLTKAFNQLNVSKRVEVEGFKSASAGFEVNIDNLGLEIFSIKGDYVSDNTTGIKTYVVKANFKMPLIVKASDQGNVFYEEQFYTQPAEKILFSGKTEYDYELWRIENVEKEIDPWVQIQKELWTNIFDKVNTSITEKVGYPKKTDKLEIYVPKKHQDYTYDELVNALTNAQSAYASLSYDRDKATAKASLAKAIAIWEEELKSSDLDDKKARINKKITGLISANLADAYFWSENFEKANLYINKAITNGTVKSKSHCKKLKQDIPEFQSRYNASN